MIQKIKFITLIDLLFMFILAISGSIKNEVLSDTVYYLAFVIPVFAGISYIISQREKLSERRSDIARSLLRDFTVNKRDALLSLPVIFVGIGAVLLISLATSFLMELAGFENTASFDEPFLLSLLIHAFVPALLEELLFRFIPVNLLRDEPKTAILITSIFFSFAHANLFQIPYAFAAGVIFSSLYIASGSILPCILMHFLNNALSLTSIYGYGSSALWITFASLVAASLVFIAIRAKAYIAPAKKLTSGSKIELGYSPLLLIAVSLTFAISALFA